MQALEVTIDITVQCEKCGNELSANYNTRRKILTVDPCVTCVGEANSAGYKRGLDEGLED